MKTYRAACRFQYYNVGDEFTLYSAEDITHADLLVSAGLLDVVKDDERSGGEVSAGDSESTHDVQGDASTGDGTESSAS
jgi:hypothetical protein